MTTGNRVLCLLTLAGVLGFDQPILGQIAPTAADSLKGRIWTATARRVWTTDAKMAAKKPQEWRTSQEFMGWLMAKSNATLAKNSELGILQTAVVSRIKSQNNGNPNGTPSQVAQAIEAEIAERKQNKAGALARVDITALQADLAGFTPATPTPSAATPITKDSQAAAVTEDVNPTPDPPAEAEPAVVYQTRPASYFGLSPAVAGTLLALLGAALGAGVVALLKPARRSGRRHREVPLSSEPDTSIDMFKQDRAQKSEIQRLKGRIHHLEREMTELNAQLATYTSPAPAADLAPVAEPVPASSDDEALTIPPLPEPTAAELLIPTSAPTPPATRYGPVQETPFLEDRKLADMSLPQLALMLTIHPATPDEASFTLNPQVNQSMLIGDGLNRLQKFFDYDPPVGRISSVTAAAPGRLLRQADGWQVAERARLTIR